MKLLIVDDNEESAELLSLLLSGLGFKTKVAYEGTSALALFDRWSPDAVLLDIEMPGLNGFDVAKAIRSGKLMVLLIAISGRPAPPDAEVKQLGFNYWFRKPADIVKLVLILQHDRRDA